MNVAESLSIVRTDPFTKALACKLAKASWHVMHDDAPYDPQRVFGGGKP